MEDKRESVLDSKVFKIPIEEFEKDLNNETIKEKKEKILELFTSSNNLHSEEEFEEIKQNLHESCSEGEIDLIKIYLSEIIENDSKSFKFKIDKKNHTASLFKINNEDLHEETIIPRTIKHESADYLITSISGTSQYIGKLKYQNHFIICI